MKRDGCKSWLIYLVLFSLVLPSTLSFGGGGGGGGCTPSSASPCSTTFAAKSCYRSENEAYAGSTPSGNLIAGDAGYYFPTLVCLLEEQDVGCGQKKDCTCQSGKYLHEADAKISEADSDNSGEMCGCYQGVWDNSGKCCGDDIEDCSRASGTKMCFMDANRENAQWKDASSSSNQGDIVSFCGVARFSYRPTATSSWRWEECATQPFTKTGLRNHQYRCSGVTSSCSDTSWLPDPSQVQAGTDFTQVSNCCRTRAATGSGCSPGQERGRVKLSYSISDCDCDSESGTCSSTCRGSPTSCSVLSGSAQCTTKTETVESWDPEYGPSSYSYTVIAASCPAGSTLEFVSGLGSKDSYGLFQQEVYMCKDTCEGAQQINTGQLGSNTCLSSLVECCGSEGCNSKTDGERLSTGGSIVDSGQINYCASTFEFTTNLDEPKYESTCKNAKLPGSNGLPALYKWTGTRCCGEVEDGTLFGKSEYYSDTSSGCWSGREMKNNEFVSSSTRDVIYTNGKFYGCAISKTNYNVVNNALLSIIDEKTGSTLIKEAEYCMRDGSNSNFCSFTEKWLPISAGQARNTLKSYPDALPLGALQKAECCASMQCWDGGKCVNDQSSNPSAPNALDVNGQTYRCMKGEWKNSPIKKTSDGTGSGYCPEVSDCLLNAAGNAAENYDTTKNPQCLKSGQHKGDNMCLNGMWKTRTSKLAVDMMKILPSGPSTLFCDKTTTTLNDASSVSSSGKAIVEYLGANPNNICVLRQGAKVYVGTTSNVPLTGQALNDIFSVDCPSTLVSSEGYHKCGGTNTLWYNKKDEMFIYSTTSFTMEPLSFVALLSELLENPLATISASLKDALSLSQLPFEGKIPTFQRLYLWQNEANSKQIFAIIEGTEPSRKAAIRYSNFNSVDICSFVQQYATQKGISSSFQCIAQGTNTYVYIRESLGFSIEQSWLDMTSKLRMG